MQDLMSKSMPDFKEGSIVKGRILEIRPREVLVDIGYKSEGVIPTAEFDDIESLEVGDEVEVLLERLENDEGMTPISRLSLKFFPSKRSSFLHSSTICKARRTSSNPEIIGNIILTFE